MTFLQKNVPRQFNYKPRVFKRGEEEKTVRFQRKTLFDPHRHAGRPAILLGIAIAVMIIIYFLGGIKARVSVPELTEENIASKLVEEEN